MVVTGERFLYLALVLCRKISTFADKACKTEQENQ